MRDLKPLDQQVVVVTGASSGIGRATALLLAELGGRVVPIARSRDALDDLADEITRSGGRAHPVVADVSDYDALRKAADEAVGVFGRIDTWVNNAAVGLYGTVRDTEMDEIRRVIEVDLLGQIHGTKAALPHLEREGRGAIINVSSSLAYRSVPLQSAYCAAKRGVTGFTESLWSELDREGSDISVTLVVPSSIDTPFFEHARSNLPERPRALPPVYAPETVARAIAFAAQQRRRRITVGGAGKLLDMLERLSPRLLDAVLAIPGVGYDMQLSEEPDDGRDILFEPMHDAGRVTGRPERAVRRRSRYTEVVETRHRGLFWSAVTLGALALLAVRRGNARSRPDKPRQWSVRSRSQR